MSANDSRPNFVDAVTRKTVVVKIRSGVVAIKQFSFIDYVRFVNAKKRIDNESAEKKLAALVEIINLSKVAERIAIDDVPSVLAAILDVNGSFPVLAWQQSVISELDSKKEEQFDSGIEYDNRTIASVVALLASVFGWSAEYILRDLTYYEVSCYTQEAMLIEYRREELLYNLSEAGIEKVGNEYVKRPYQKLSWMVANEMPKSAELPEKFRPSGYVDLTDPKVVARLRKK